MSADRVLQLKLIADVGDISKKMGGVAQDVDKASTRWSRAFGDMKASAKSWGQALGSNLVLSGIGAVTSAITDGVKGFQEGEDAARQLGITWKNLKLPGQELADTIGQVGQRALDLGFDDAEAVRAYDDIITKTKDRAASNKIMALSYDIARKKGISLSAAEKIATGVYLGKAKALETVGIDGKSGAKGVDAVSKATDNLKGSSDAYARSHPLDVLIGKVNDGFELAGQIVVPTLNDIADFLTRDVIPGLQDLARALGPLAPLIGAVALGFGALAIVLWANPIFLIAGAIAAIVVGLGFLTTAIRGNEDANKSWTTGLDGVVGGLQEIVDFAVNVFGPFVRPIFDNIATTWDLAQSLIHGDFSKFTKGLGRLAQAGIDMILSPFQSVWELIKSGFDGLGIDVGSAIADLVNGVIDILNSINNLSWGGESFDLYNIPQSVADFLHIPANGKFNIPSGSFQLWPDLGHVSAPKHDGGKVTYGKNGRGHANTGKHRTPPPVGKDAPTPPNSHASGLGFVPYDEYPALLHRREAVLNAQQADQWRAGGGGGNVTVNVTFTGLVTDPIGTAKQIQDLLRQYGLRSGGVS